MTPLYKRIKSQGNSFYAFPSAAEDISASYQNNNYKMYFSKYVLLNIPKQNIDEGVDPIYMDFDNSFKKSINSTDASTFQDQMIESLRNYVANQEVVIKESKVNNTNYYYDNNALETTTEKIFFKWAKKLNIIDFEPAIPDDEYFSNLKEFESKNINDFQHFPEYLWKEREVTPFIIKSASESGGVFVNKIEIEFNTKTNFKVGDTTSITSDVLGDVKCKVLAILEDNKVVFDILVNGIDLTIINGNVELVYNRFIKYVGEVNGVSNVQESNRSYTEVHAHIPDHTGETPDVLFRTLVDDNYKPNGIFPILPNQLQPEIIGAELFSSPIVSSPQNYPGSYFGQFDTLDFTYETATGDSLRRSGDYYGVSGDLNNTIVDGSTIDGISIDFNTSHYVKMNILGKNLTNFDQFNALPINNEPPKAFEFNSILWYYNVEDSDGNVRTNLYGISFLDNPDNTEIVDEAGFKFPTYKKFVSNGYQDGTSYAFSLNLNFNIINDNIQETYNPEAINSMFSMNLFNQAMSRLSATNDSFLTLIGEQGVIRDEVNNIKGLLYTQTDISVINTKIQSLETLLRLYSTMQLVSSDTISVNTIPGTPPSLMLDSNATTLERVYSYKASEMFNEQGIIPINISVPKKRDFLINFINDDNKDIVLSDSKLTFLLDKDLDYRQSVEFFINANQTATQNKKIDIYMKSNIDMGDNSSAKDNEILVVGSIDLPIYYNSLRQLPNSAYLWKEFKFTIDFSNRVDLDINNKLVIKLNEPGTIVSNSIKAGDVLFLNNLFVSDNTSIYDFSAQYVVQNVLLNTITLDISSNPMLVSFAQDRLLPFDLIPTLSNLPYFTLNKGKIIKLTRVSDSNILSERYLLQIEDIK